MPRIKAREEEYAAKDFLMAIQTACMVPGERMTKALIAHQTGIPETTIKTRINDPFGFSVRELRKLVNAGVPGEAILAVCGCKPAKPQKSASANEIADLLREAIRTIIEEETS